jgi:hypothetical protein
MGNHMGIIYTKAIFFGLVNDPIIYIDPIGFITEQLPSG